MADGKTKTFVKTARRPDRRQQGARRRRLVRRKTYLAARNHGATQLVTAADVNVEQLLNYHKIIIIGDALPKRSPERTPPDPCKTFPTSSKRSASARRPPFSPRRTTSYVFEVHPKATKLEIEQAVQRAVRQESGRRQHRQLRRQSPPPAHATRRPHRGLEESRSSDSRRAKRSTSPKHARSSRQPESPTSWLSKHFRPLTPSNRYKALPAFDEITKRKPEKSLYVTLKKSGGRNNSGRITCRHIGGGHKRRYRLMDFKRARTRCAAKVVGHRVRSEPLGPHRPHPVSGWAEELHPGSRELQVGATVMAGEKAAPEVGNALPLSQIPLGLQVHNIELEPGRGGKIARAAGQAAILTNREGDSPSSRCPPVKSARSTSDCSPPSARSGTSIT